MRSFAASTIDTATLHRHGDARRKPENRNETCWNLKTSVSCETSFHCITLHAYTGDTCTHAYTHTYVRTHCECCTMDSWMKLFQWRMQDHYIVRNHQGLSKLRICHPMAIESLQDQKRLPGLQEPIHPCSLLDCALEILELSRILFVADDGQKQKKYWKLQRWFHLAASMAAWLPRIGMLWRRWKAICPTRSWAGHRGLRGTQNRL